MRRGYSPEPKHDLVVAQVSVVIDGQDGLRLDLIPWQEPVVQAVFLCANNLRGEHTIVTMAVHTQRRDLGVGAAHGPTFCLSFVAPVMGKHLLSKKHQPGTNSSFHPSPCRLLPVSPDGQSQTQAMRGTSCKDGTCGRCPRVLQQ